jgi:hypothetical protein
MYSLPQDIENIAIRAINKDILLLDLDFSISLYIL